MSSKQKISITGYDYDKSITPPWNANFGVVMELNSDDKVSGFSQPITVRAFKHMREKFLTRLESIFTDYNGSELNDETVQVTFGKEAILILLSQQDCSGITFCFGINDIPDSGGIIKERVTLMACGAMPTNTPPGFENIGKARFDLNEIPNAEDPPIYEVVPGTTYGEVKIAVADPTKKTGDTFSNFL